MLGSHGLSAHRQPVAESSGRHPLTDTQCAVCRRTFSRADHCARHTMTHSHNKPFNCAHCNETFQRPDALHRHVRKSCPSSSSLFPRSSQDQARASTACDSCHLKKLKCYGGRPCKPCSIRDVPCAINRRIQRQRGSTSFSTGAESMLSTRNLQKSFSLPGKGETIPTPDVLQRGSTQGDAMRIEDSGPSQVAQQPMLLRRNDYDANSESMLPADTVSSDLLSKGVPQVFNTSQAFQTDLQGNLPFYFPTDNELNLAGNFNYFDASLIFPTSIDAFCGMDLDFDQLLNAPSVEILQSSPNVMEGHANDSAPSSSLENMISALDLSDPLDRVTKLWLRLPFIPQRYDLELIELLLTVGQRHLSTAFLTFTGQLIDKHTLPVQIIAMAAMGALFSGCSESYDIGRWLFTDSHRMVSDTLFRSKPMSLEATGSFLKAMIALEICGLCSGHMRSSEISEANHQALVQILTDFREKSSSTNDEEYQKFHDDVLLLEAYRVTLLQLQPLCPPGQARTGTNSKLLFTPSGPDSSLGDSESDCPPSPSPLPLPSPYHQFARISILSYFAFAYPEHRKLMACKQNWRPETIEVYMDDFATKYRLTLRDRPSLEILLRTNLWVMRSPVETFHRIAYEISQTGPASSDVWVSFLSRWRNHPNYHIMMDQVVRVLDRAEELVSSSPHFVEAPHDAFSTYLGTLALCLSQIPAAGRLDEHSEIAKQIRRGVKLVGSFRVTSVDGMRRILSLVYERVVLRQGT